MTADYDRDVTEVVKKRAEARTVIRQFKLKFQGKA